MLVPLRAQRNTAQSLCALSALRKTCSSSCRPWAPAALNFGENQLWHCWGGLLAADVGCSAWDAFLITQSTRRVDKFSTSFRTSRTASVSPCSSLNFSCACFWKSMRLFDASFWTSWLSAEAASRFSCTTVLSFLIFWSSSSWASWSFLASSSAVFLCSARQPSTRWASFCADCFSSSSRASEAFCSFSMDASKVLLLSTSASAASFAHLSSAACSSPFTASSSLLKRSHRLLISSAMAARS
mmetsp:Transcript_14544/g.37333  ORF Transcript_14544/g.37333 Transcript_14544/m.37333 type:complete len:242 (-) Transcript_14544:418-1143(-)